MALYYVQQLASDVTLTWGMPVVMVIYIHSKVWPYDPLQVIKEDRVGVICLCLFQV